MFPNPQSALPLPRRPNRERYKSLAKDLVKACKSGHEHAIGQWAEKWIDGLVKQSDLKLPARKLRLTTGRWIDQVEEFAKRTLSNAPRCRLADAQLVVARSHGFDSWSTFLNHLEGLLRKSSSISRFESAASAIVAGDIKTLKRLLSEDPSLVHARSTREHKATLLHYVSANGVEGYRQRTPKNIVAIARALLDAGAEVDAEADVYGGGATTLGLVATSVHPFRAGVQNPLMQLLLDHGADINHQTAAGNRQDIVSGALANGRLQAAEYLADRGAQLNFETAAGVGSTRGLLQ